MSIARRASGNIALKALGEMSRFAWALLLILVARRLGGEALGRISFAFSFTYICVLLTDLGLTILVVREIARDRAAAGYYLGNLLSLKLISAPVTLGVIGAVILLSRFPPEVVTVVVLFAGINLARGVLELYGAIFSGLEVMGREAILKHVYQVSLLLSGGIALALGCGPKGVAVALLIASLLTVAIGSGMVRRTIPFVRPLWDGAFWSAMLRRAFPIALTTVFLVLCNESDIVLLSYLGQGERAVGWYAAASKVLKMLQLIPMLVVGGIYPVFSDLARGPKGSLNTAYSGILKLLLTISVPAAIIVAGFAEPIVRLVYGPDFTPAILPLRLLACSVPFLYLGYVFVNILVSSDHLIWAALATGGAAAINIVANLLLIPALGISGSAWAAIAAQAGLVVIGGMAAERIVARSKWLQLAFRPVAAGAGMLVAIALLWGIHWAVAFAAGFGTYLLVLVGTGALREEEFIAVRRLWRGAEAKRLPW